MNTIQWKTKAFKQLRKLPPKQQATLYEAVQSLAAMPDVHNVKALKKHQYDYRLRVGNYRVLFDWDGGIRIVQIQEVRKRDERTY
ncbi:type II toxin-antitoxin system RelE family toxin [Salinicola rhizosphaerae]|uniref:Cytotoxic translational repressor of toxin-antitoxin stability system n=1 Tax=Salinicola rhizosphaerae TaxID=1443141 RepID=A0ABQ3EDI1_9GAMM|nr:type II toxin-antitoxin system RelE/ParE family toxin [Salinicola rhizosphaerae]GHB27433.1 cytotoxic translational repressor of toxin-antitoxin stability system [Salinicola rhizosphaerae]